MKTYLILAGIVVAATSLQAQENSAVKDKIEEAVVTKVIVNDGKNVESKVVKEEITTKENKVQLSDQAGETINQNIEYVPSEGKKTIRVNKDPSVNLLKTQYYLYQNKRYLFTPDKNGFHISLSDAEGRRQKKTGKTLTISAPNYYLMVSEGRTGVGHFDQYGNFVVEFYDKISDKIVTERYAPLN